MHADPAAEIVDLLQGIATSPAPSAERARAVADVAARWDRSGGLVEPVLEQWLRLAIIARAEHGWRPVDIARAVVAHAPAPQAELVQQLGHGVGPWRVRRRLGGPEAVAHIVDVRALIARLGSIPFVGDQGGGGRGVDPAVLSRVRALLAKAESTTFEAEAEALVAKAHQLMVRHAIDDAVVDSGHGRGHVTACRVFIDDPYRRGKFVLLARVADASSCRALLSEAFGMATVFGQAADLEAVELLYTSLLLQATGGVTRARPAGERRWAPSQVAAFRRSWLLAFAQRIGERLEAASAAAVADATEHHGAGLLPVLAAKADAVEAALRDAAPRVRELRTTASSGEGWQAGRAAADRATLTGAPPLPAAPGALGRG